MKSVLVSLSFTILSLFVFACQKSDNTVTPVDTMPGEYKITGTVSYTIEGAITTSALSGTLSVYPGNERGSYYFIERYPTTELGYLTTHNNGSFSVQGVPDFSVYNSVKYYGYQTGGGTTSTNTIKFDRYANTESSTYIAPTGTSYSYTKKISKHVSITATK